MRDSEPECHSCGSLDVVLIDGAYGLLRCIDCETIFSDDAEEAADDRRNWQGRRTREGYDDDAEL